MAQSTLKPVRQPTEGQSPRLTECQKRRNRETGRSASSPLLKPLGNPPQNGIKFFSTAEVTEMAKDRAWLAKTNQAISQHWHKRNVRQKSNSRNGDAMSAVQGALGLNGTLMVIAAAQSLTVSPLLLLSGRPANKGWGRRGKGSPKVFIVILPGVSLCFPA
jgi:hypothetical protein